MNKELINKYKAEFEHYLNDGTCIYKLQTDKWYQNVELIFTDYDYRNLVTAVVINDEYAKLRKALSEGRTIQLYDVLEQHPLDPSQDRYGWRDFKSLTQSSAFSKSVDSYRIKPDEPQFKVGDYVRYIHSTSDKALQINNINGG